MRILLSHMFQSYWKSFILRGKDYFYVQFYILFSESPILSSNFFQHSKHILAEQDYDGTFSTKINIFVSSRKILCVYGVEGRGRVRLGRRLY